MKREAYQLCKHQALRQKRHRRDLKSSNVLLSGNGRAKVCDFGIAKFKDRYVRQTSSHESKILLHMCMLTCLSSCWLLLPACRSLAE